MRGIAALALVLGLFNIASPVSASIIVNGSFEANNVAHGSTFITNTLTGWHVERDTVRLFDLNGFDPHRYNTPYGDQWLELGGRDHHATIWQDVTGLTVGETYSLTFDLASEYIVADSAGLNITYANLTGYNFTGFFTAPANPADDSEAWNNWTSFAVTFVAHADSVRIHFFGGDGTGNNLNYAGYDIGLDNVALNRVESAETPEPASLAIWGGIGIGGLVAGWRRKRMQAAKV